MREIKFRGKRIDNGEWVYGVPILKGEWAYMIDDLWQEENQAGVNVDVCEAIAVFPETVGQFIELDVNGVEIFEHDIVKQHFEYDDELDVIEDIRFLPSYNLTKSEVVGNTNDNPGQLEAVK